MQRSWIFRAEAGRGCLELIPLGQAFLPPLRGWPLLLAALFDSIRVYALFLNPMHSWCFFRLCSCVPYFLLSAKMPAGMRNDVRAGLFDVARRNVVRHLLKATLDETADAGVARSGRRTTPCLSGLLPPRVSALSLPSLADSPISRRLPCRDGTR
jgi:hypothetical protein